MHKISEQEIECIKKSSHFQPDSIITEIDEYGEGYAVIYEIDRETGRYVLTAYNEGGFNCTSIDAEDTYIFLKSIYEQK